MYLPAEVIVLRKDGMVSVRFYDEHFSREVNIEDIVVTLLRYYSQILT